ncbi:hypothetical protein EIP91_010234 [Steccherinum ochraceum]|uniref:Uncharacterized protein n=1 Tax=Steccherinum ochraceum TaxID=92696 RepID=A0A4R0R327_9APHY|nr:hypothetical protein EIP91_010234 [Steccherinum ochraceum]
MKSFPRHFEFGPSKHVSDRVLADRTAGAMGKLFETGFPYSKKLSMHTSCVNSLTLSSDGRFLASGGDDPYVYLWDLHQDDLTRPACGFIGHKGNVFSMAFSATNKYLYTGDTDNDIHMYDMSRVDQLAREPGEALRSFSRHENSIRALSGHPENEHLLLSASEDGTIKQHDTRVGGPAAQGVLTQRADFTSVQYHPSIPHMFVTGTNTGFVCLRDIRSSFGHTPGRAPVVHTYVTALSKSSSRYLYMPEVGSTTFDKTGSKLAVTMLHHRPTIYSLMDPLPLATCSGLNAPDGTRITDTKKTYSNCCTIKHGSFGGPGLHTDEYYAAGSDDFRAYVWKIPDLRELTQRRESIAYERWQHLQESADQREPIVGFTSRNQDARCVPIDLSTPLFRLGGHKSIVNSTLIHPHHPMIFTSGVERHILLHSPLPASPCTSALERTPEGVRSVPRPNVGDTRLYVRALLSGRTDTEDGEDRETVALFDHILREEGDLDLFDVPSRIWDPDEEESEDEDEEGVGMEVDSDDDLYL